MRYLVQLSAVLLLVAVADAQQCSFKDRGFFQCVANYTNWVQVQLAQIKDLSITIISKLPEPEVNAPRNVVGGHFKRNHLVKRAIVDGDFDSKLAEDDESTEETAQVSADKAWIKFRDDVCHIIDRAITNGSHRLLDGVRTMKHDRGVYDVRSLLCVYTSVSRINVEGSAALQKLYKSLPVDRRARFEKAVGLQIWIAALKIADVQKNLEKQIKNCYMLLG